LTPDRHALRARHGVVRRRGRTPPRVLLEQVDPPDVAAQRVEAAVSRLALTSAVAGKRAPGGQVVPIADIGTAGAMVTSPQPRSACRAPTGTCNLWSSIHGASVSGAYQMIRPQLSQLPPLLQEVSSQIGPLNLAADLVVQRPFRLQQTLWMHTRRNPISSRGGPARMAARYPRTRASWPGGTCGRCRVWPRPF
jgi:hypothetical protein